MPDPIYEDDDQRIGGADYPGHNAMGCPNCGQELDQDEDGMHCMGVAPDFKSCGYKSYDPEPSGEDCFETALWNATEPANPYFPDWS